MRPREAYREANRHGHKEHLARAVLSSPKFSYLYFRLINDKYADCKYVLASTYFSYRYARSFGHNEHLAKSVLRSSRLSFFYYRYAKQLPEMIDSVARSPYVSFAMAKTCLHPDIRLLRSIAKSKVQLRAYRKFFVGYEELIDTNIANIINHPTKRKII